ncbi:MAG TPA: DegT/DnrJ/EryC1/StrS family aminotransferase [Ignavibacteria bacterium]|nr:DegT/DnrJ/EryC1/StrS family aminotransferase [Ignavibacteria bacterium]
MNKKNIQMVDTGTQYQKIKSEIDNAIHSVIDSTQFIQGPAVKKFENNVEKYLGTKHAIGCASGTDALQIAMMALDIKPGDEIITTPFTFVATTETIAILGAVPVYVDIEPATFNIDVSKIEAKITPKTKAIMPVHLYGQPCDMDPIMKIAEKHGLFVIEDAAQAMGARYKDKMICTIGHIGCISFYPSKNLGAFGDGGMLTTNDNDLAEKIRMIISHGSKRKYYHETLGVNSRLDSIQAAILDVKLKYLDDYCDQRHNAAMKYNGKFKGIFETPYIMPGVKHIFHQYSIRVKNRDEMMEFLKSQGIPSMIYYPVPLHMQEAYKYDYKPGDYPVSEEIAKDIISLPMHTELIDEEIDFIASKVIEFNSN